MIETILKEFGTKLGIYSIKNENLKEEPFRSELGKILIYILRGYGVKCSVQHCRYYADRELTHFEKGFIEKLKYYKNEDLFFNFISNFSSYACEDAKDKNLFALPYGGKVIVKMTHEGVGYKGSFEFSTFEKFDRDVGLTFAVKKIATIIIKNEIKRFLLKLSQLKLLNEKEKENLKNKINSFYENVDKIDICEFLESDSDLREIYGKEKGGLFHAQRLILILEGYIFSDIIKTFPHIDFNYLKNLKQNSYKK